jgi:hypothetical protein
MASNLAGTIPGTNSDNLFWGAISNFYYGMGIVRVFTTNSASTPVPVSGAMTPDGQYVASLGATTSAYIWNTVYVWNTSSGTAIYTNVITNAPLQIGLGISPDGTRLGVTWYRGTAGAVIALDRIAQTSNNLAFFPSGFHYYFRFSGDSRYMAYVGSVSAANQTNQIYLYDFVAHTNILISQSTNGVAGNGNSDSPDISSDGRFIAYRSAASNLGPGASNGVPNLYLYDSVAGTTALISGNSPLSGRSLTPVFSADAQTLVFASWDGGFGSQDFNQSSDVFTMDLYSTNVPPPFAAALMAPNGPGGLPVITWTPQSGKSYQVQFKNNLSDPVWQVLNGSGTVSNNQQSVTDPAPAGQRFYRVVAH